MSMTEEQKKYWDNHNERLYKEFLKKKAEFKVKQQIIYN